MAPCIRGHAELFREPDQALFSPGRMASAFKIDLTEFAAALGVQISTLRLQPENPKAQALMRDLNRVFLALLVTEPDVDRAAFHMMNTQIRLLQRRTLFEAVRDGEHEKALRYLQTAYSGPVEHRIRLTLTTAR